jgi:hypothetical protein
VSRFTDRSRLERALLALTDPEGEIDAAAPVGQARALATVQAAVRHVYPDKVMAAIAADDNLFVSYYVTPADIEPYPNRPREIVEGALRPRSKPAVRVRAAGRVEPSAILAALKVDPLAEYGMVSCPVHQDEHPSLRSGLCQETSRISAPK